MAVILYELILEDYFFIIFVIMFILIPFAVGVIAQAIRDWYANKN